MENNFCVLEVVRSGDEKRAKDVIERNLEKLGLKKMINEVIATYQNGKVICPGYIFLDTTKEYNLIHLYERLKKLPYVKNILGILNINELGLRIY